MAEFCDVARAYIRMCDSFGSVCNGCPIDVHGNDIYVCRNRVLKEPQKYETDIMAWAAAHPEPVYPTFGEWLEKQGIVKLVNSDRYDEDGRKVYMLLESVENQIPDDIAEKLGIEPKEG